MTHSFDSGLAGQHAKVQPSQWFGRKAAVSVMALGAAVGTGLVLPGSAFHARAVVAISDAASPLAAVLQRTVADAVVSKPVMMRAAESLISTGFPAPDPDLAERAAVAARLNGAKATGKTARLAADLPRMVTAKPGEVAGTLDIIAASGNAERAAQVASAVADALVVDHDDMTALARRKHDLDVSARVERLKAEAVVARRQLAALGGFQSDPTQMLAAAMARTAAAKARVATIRAILASGSPPLSDRRDVPSAIETLQANYLDLSGQLAKARETLGDRHSTIISLQAEFRHASASLTAGWRRLGRMAEAELDAARDREAGLRKVDTGADASRREALEEARRNVQVAEDNVVRAFAAQRDSAFDERGYRVAWRPLAPNASDGFSTLARVLMAGVVGLLVLGFGRLLSKGSRRPRLVAIDAPEAGTVGAAERMDANVVDLVARREPTGAENLFVADPLEDQHDAKETDVGAQLAPEEDDVVRSQDTSDVETSLARALADLLPQIDAIVPAFGPVPTVMVAANEAGTEATSTALALAGIAADRGRRVLLVEATRSRPDLTAAADADADPILVDLYGVLRIALRATSSEGVLFLAPSLQQGARLASALARQGETPLIDDIAAEFDLIVVDGGRGADAAAAGWGADVYLRVGRYRSKRDDDQLAATFGASRAAILGAVVASTLTKTDAAPVSSTPRSGASSVRAPQKAPSQPNGVAPALSRQVPPRRKIAGR